MFKKLVYVEVIIAVSILVILGIFAFGFQNIEITVINRTTDEVHVSAYRQNQQMDIGKLSPSAHHQFTLNNEGAVRFVAQFANGRELETEPLYFSEGISIRLIITKHAIEASYDSGS